MLAWVKVAILLAALAAGFTSGWKTRAWKSAADDKATAAKQEADNESDRLRKYAAGMQYEQWKAAQRPKTVAAGRALGKALEAAPTWGGMPVPASVRDSLAATAVDTGAAVPDGGVPAVPAAADPDQQRPGFGLRLGAGLGLGLQSQTSRAR